jgi:hypothetical protein
MGTCRGGSVVLALGVATFSLGLLAAMAPFILADRAMDVVVDIIMS